MEPLVLHILMSLEGSVINGDSRFRSTGLGDISRMVWLPLGPLQWVISDPKSIQVIRSALAVI